MTVDFPFIRRVGRLEIEYWVTPRYYCDACGKEAEVRVGDEREWRLTLCHGCANDAGTKIARMGRDIRGSLRDGQALEAP